MKLISDSAESING